MSRCSWGRVSEESIGTTVLWGSAFTGSPAECLELPEGPVALLGILKHAADSTVGKNCLWTTFIDSRVLSYLFLIMKSVDLELG